MNKKVYLLENCIDCPDSYGYVTTNPIEKKEYLAVYCERLGKVCEYSVGIDSECPLFNQKDITPTKLIEVNDAVEDLTRHTSEIQKKYHELKGRYEQLKKDYDDLKSLRSFPIDELPLFEKKSVPYYIDAIGDKPPFDSGIE